MIGAALKFPVAALAAAFLVTVAGGKVGLKVSGAVTGAADITDAGFCVTHVAMGKDSLHVFAFAGNNVAWGVSITSASGMPKVGAHAIDGSVKAVKATVIDKRTGKAPREWQHYDAVDGTVTLTRADAGGVAGSFKFNAAPTMPKSTGGSVAAEGTFEAAQMDGCDAAKRGKP